ncbi:integral membrane protein [Aspergillus flavus]|nr:integral membrane protein [Aspergillus flavus]
MDLVACIIWARWRRWRSARGRWSRAESLAPKLADSGVFAASAAVVMWAWFYLPERLPKSYGKWIGEVAKVDSRLIEALRRARRGVFVYGKDTGQAPLLESMCKDYGWPIEWGDPSKTIPIPCEMVHMSCGPNCEKHAVSRFARTFGFACATYIPLQIVFRLRRLKSVLSLRRAVSDALRSSAFLASFVSIFYYSVCLARTRIGPKIFPRDVVTPMMWDSGLCVGAGCLICGWSILVESPSRRQELALFVAPRAAATVLPRFYDKQVWFTLSV